MSSPAACRSDPECLLKHTGCDACRVRSISVCAALDPGELSELEALNVPMCFANRQSLFAQGDAVTSAFNITDGCVRLSKVLPDGRRQIVGFAMPGDFLGLSMEDTYGFSAEAIGPVEACRFQQKSFSAYMFEKPQLMRRLLEFAGHELSLAQDQMVVLGRRSAEERVAAFLTQLRLRRERLGKASPTLPLPMSRQDIADYLGLTIETVSRTLSRFAREKIILIVPDGVRLMQQDRLSQLAAA